VYMVAPPITLLTGMLPVKVDAMEFAVHWLPFFLLGVLANVALGRGSFRYVQTEQYNLLKMFTFISASTVLIWRRPLRFRVTPKRVDATAHALDRRELLPHAGLLALIVVGAAVGVLNLVWGFTARYSDPAVVVVTLVWAVASGGLLASTLIQILRRLHSRGGYRFSAPVPGWLTVANGTVVAVDSEDLSVGGCSLVVPDRPLATGPQILLLQLPDASLRLHVDVLHNRALGDGRRRLGVRFRAMTPADHERLVEFLYVTVARYQSDPPGLRGLLAGDEGDERVELAA
jgi:cellulose synthase (UDP-forming)